jgi:hypothetical protein
MQPGTVVLQAGQDSKITLIGKLTAELLDVVNAILLVLVGASVLGKGFGRQAREQREGQEILVHLRFPSFCSHPARRALAMTCSLLLFDRRFARFGEVEFQNLQGLQQAQTLRLG